MGSLCSNTAAPSMAIAAMLLPGPIDGNGLSMSNVTKEISDIIVYCNILLINCKVHWKYCEVYVFCEQTKRGALLVVSFNYLPETVGYFIWVLVNELF